MDWCCWLVCLCWCCWPVFFVLRLLSSGDVMILLAGIFVVVLTLIWYIMMVECIYKVTVDNGVNHWMVWIHVNFNCIDSFKDKFHWRGEHYGELVDMWLTFKYYKFYLKGIHVALEMFQCWQFHDVFSCEVVDLSCLISHQY